jgi:hypothetical protein
MSEPLSVIRERQNGLNAQKQILPIIKEFFNRDIKEIEARFSKYDFQDEEYIYELKSRTNAYSAYPTTLEPADKIIENWKKQIFLFKFTDGLYYINYSKELFDTFEKKEYRRYRQDWNDKEKLYYFIPIDKLNKIC